MGDKETSSSLVRLAGPAFIIAIAAFYISAGHEWYFDGKMLLCTYEEISKPTSWCHRPDPPASTPEVRARPSDCVTRARTADEILACNYSEYNRGYDELKKFWGDDIISKFFENIYNMFKRWFMEWVNGWFWPEFAPKWNTFFSADTTEASHHRLAFGIVVAIFYAQLVSKVIGSTFDWLHGK